MADTNSNSNTNSNANKYIDYDGMGIYTEEVKKLIKKIALESSDKIKTYQNHLYFPTTGSTDTLYVAQEENKTYRWDEDALKFFCVGSDWEEISVIDGNN